MNQHFFWLLLTSLSLLSCKEEDSDSQITQLATYNVTFTGTWSAQSHPTDFPSNDHFSPIAGMTHNASVHLFEAGTLASEGIEQMAETGGTTSLNNEINDLISEGNAERLISEGSLNSGSTSISFDLTITDNFPLVSLVTMVAPSPDWFIGVTDVNLFENGEWVLSKEVSAILYDSGTDSGLTFTAENADTDPAEMITLLVDPPLGNGSKVTPLGTFTFEKVN